MLMAKVFKGTNVYMSRNLVPPEMFDTLHDALKLNGAQVYLCCDPSRNAPNEYHIISSLDHEKFEDLRSKGCNLIGPQCVLSCAKEHRPLPNQGFTCCLAMDGVKILASGFDAEEKVEIGKLVNAMGGILYAKTSMDVNFVIVKNVLAAKYRWALNQLKKPIVSINWLHQCWKEHRVVPQESFRVHPFSGLTICVTGIPPDERKEVEKMVFQNGGKYSRELTRNCTHLICDARKGLKYMVAQSWGCIRIVSKSWLNQSVDRRACLNEESYPVQSSSTSTTTAVRMKNQNSLENVTESVQSLSSTATRSNSLAVSCGHAVDSDIGATLSQNMPSSFSGAPFFSKGEESDPPAEQKTDDNIFDDCVAGDSQTDDNDLFLSDCRLLILGFSASEMRKLVSMVRKGGGSRYMSLNEKLTHIIVGSPSQIEANAIRNLAALGVIHVVKPDWLADCISEKKEVPVLRKHIANDILFPREPINSNRGTSANIAVAEQGKSSENVQCYKNFGSGNSLEKSKEVDNVKNKGASQIGKGSCQPQFCTLNGKDEKQMQASSSKAVEDIKSSVVFKGRRFCFSSSFPANQRAEIVQWVNQGGGELVKDQIQTDVHFTIECHGVIPSQTDAATVTYVSSHWIKSCLEEGHLLDVGSHIIYSPLPCQIPFPAFKSFHLCVSQYDEKERLLLRNLCFVLGAKFGQKLHRRATHLLCRFTSGPKYELACRLGIQSVTCEWIYECIKQNKVVAPDPFYPKEVTSKDREAGACTSSQFPTQAAQMISEDNVSQLQNQSKELESIHGEEAFTTTNSAREKMKYSPSSSKKARLLADEKRKRPLLSVSMQIDAVSESNSPKNRNVEGTKDCAIMTDVANLIEDCLEQTSKNHDQKSPSRSGCDKDPFTSDCIILGRDHGDQHSALRVSEHWTNRFDKKDDSQPLHEDVPAAIYDGFSDPQTESQVVGYAQDLSGMQMIIDRVRTSNPSMN